MAIVVIQNATLAHEPEISQSTNGTLYTTLKLAENHNTRTQHGEWERTGVTWWKTTLFGKDAENAVDNLRKGDWVTVTGYSATQEWEKDGQKHTQLVVNSAKITIQLKSKKPASAYSDQLVHEPGVSLGMPYGF